MMGMYFLKLRPCIYKNLFHIYLSRLYLNFCHQDHIFCKSAKYISISSFTVKNIIRPSVARNFLLSSFWFFLHFLQQNIDRSIAFSSNRHLSSIVNGIKATAIAYLITVTVWTTVTLTMERWCRPIAWPKITHCHFVWRPMEWTSPPKL